MPTRPIDVIAIAIRGADRRVNDKALAEVAANALNNPDVIANAAQSLKETTWGSQYTITGCEEIARIVLRSVGGE